MTNAEIKSSIVAACGEGIGYRDDEAREMRELFRVIRDFANYLEVEEEKHGD